MKRIALLLFVLGSVSTFAKDNPFLDRDFWKTDPDIAMVKELMAQGHDIAELNQYAFDGVIYALFERTNNKTILFMLDQEGNGVEKMTHDGRTYLFWAAYKSNLEIMQFLLDKGAKTDVIDDHGYSVLTFAASTGQSSTELYDVILGWGADPVKETSRSGANSLLHLAPYLKDSSLVEYWTQKGLALDSKDNNGHGMLNYTARNGNIQMMDWFLDQRLNFNTGTDGRNATYFACGGTRGARNGVETYKYLKSKGVRLQQVDDKGQTAMHYLAGREKDLLVWKYFEKEGVAVDTADKDGNTPLLLTAQYGAADVTAWLMEEGADLNASNTKGETVLGKALNGAKYDLALQLIEAGAAVSVTDKKGNTLMTNLIGAYRTKDHERFQTVWNALQTKGLDINLTQAGDNTLYHLAVKKEAAELVAVLKAYAIDIDHKNSDGLTALHMAAMTSGNLEMIHALIEAGANTTIRTDFEESVFDLASENEKLIENGTDLQFLKS